MSLHYSNFELVAAALAQLPVDMQVACAHTRCSREGEVEEFKFIEGKVGCIKVTPEAAAAAAAAAAESCLIFSVVKMPGKAATRGV